MKRIEQRRHELEAAAQSQLSFRPEINSKSKKLSEGLAPLVSRVESLVKQSVAQREAAQKSKETKEVCCSAVLPWDMSCVLTWVRPRRWQMSAHPKSILSPSNLRGASSSSRGGSVACSTLLPPAMGDRHNLLPHYNVLRQGLVFSPQR